MAPESGGNGFMFVMTYGDLLGYGRWEIKYAFKNFLIILQEKWYFTIRRLDNWDNRGTGEEHWGAGGAGGAP